MSYSKNITNNFITQLINIFLGIIVSVIVARVLGPKNKGYIEFAIIFFHLISNFGHFGIIDASPYFFKKSKYNKDDIYNNNLSFLLLMWLFVFLIVGILKMKKIILVDYNIYIIIIGMIIVLLTFYINLLKSFYISNEKIKTVNQFFLIGSFTKSILILLLSLFSLLNVYSYIFLRMFGLVLNFIFLKHKFDLKYAPNLKINLLYEEMKFGILVYGATLFIYLNYRFDQLLIKFFLGDPQLGVYSVAVMVVELIFLIPTSVKTALMGKIYNTNNFNKKQNFILIKTLKYSIYISLILALFGSVLAFLIPVIYGKEYHNAILVIRILFLGILFASVGKIVGPYLIATGKPKIHLKMTFITFLSNMIINLFLIPKFGIYGAAIASSGSYFLYGAGYIYYLNKYHNVKLKEIFLIKSNDIQEIKKYIKQFKNSQFHH